MKKNVLIVLILSMALLVHAQRKERLTDLERTHLYTNKYQKEKTPDTAGLDIPIVYGTVNNNVKTNKTTTYIVEYNFKKGIYERNNFPIKINKPVAFKITNINRLAYNIDIMHRDSLLANSWDLQTITEKDKAVVQKLTDETKTAVASKSVALTETSINDGDLKKEEVDKLQAAKADESKKKTPSEKTQDTTSKKFIDIVDMLANQPVLIGQQESLGKGMELASITIESLKLAVAQIKTDTTTATDNGKKADTLLKEKEEERAAIAEQYKKLTERIAKEKAIIQEYEGVLGIFNTSQNVVAELYKKYHLMYQDLLEIRSYYNIVRLASENPFLGHAQFKEFKSKYETDKILDNLSLMTKSLAEFDKLKYDFDIAYLALQNVRGLDKYFNDGGLIKLYATSAKQKEIVDIIYKECSKTDFPTVVHTIKQTLQALDSEDNYEIVSAPVQPLYDMVEFDIKTFLKSDYDKPHNSRSFRYRAYVSGGVRLDAGIGFAISYLNNTPVYDLVNKENSLKIAIDQKHQYLPSLLALFTLTRRSSTHVAVGMSAGIGVGMGEESGLELNNYYLGGTLMFGKTNRCAFTLGGAMHLVDKLKAGYDVGTTVSNTDVNYTSKTFRFGPFLSITYNLTKGLKDNVKYLKSFL